MREAYIRRMAKRYGLDPAALLAVASREGLSGGVGDGGHAFGPFQLNDAGGVLTNAPASHHSNQWAWSDQGINFALSHIAQVARGLHGRQAVEAIVRRFERPADPNGEVAGALAALGHTGGGGGGHVAMSRPPGGGMGQPMMGGSQRDAALMMIQAAVANSSGHPEEAPDYLQGLVDARTQTVQRVQRGQKNMGMGGGGGPIPKFAKIIGTPYTGTHTLGNWESDDAVDIAMPFGTPLRAAQNGVIGSQIGALDSSNPRMAGLRLHLSGKGQEYYYAHLSKLNVKAGQHVKKGQIIGWSGAANGVNHLHLAVRNGRAGGWLRRLVL